MGNSNNSKTRKTSASSSSDAESSSSEADLPKAANPPKTLKTKSMKRLQHQLNGKTRDFIKSNWDTAKMWNIGERIFRRMLFKEKSWKTVLEAIVKAKRKAKNDPFGWEVEAKRFEDFLGMVKFTLHHSIIR